MKKAYIRPRIEFENFELDASIAATYGGCKDIETSDNSHWWAMYQGSGLTEIMTFDEFIQSEYDGTNSNDNLCYHTVSDKIFNS